MFSDSLFSLYIIVFVIAHIVLLVAIIFAIAGYFNKDEAKKSKDYTTAAKLLLIYALMFVVGFGTCVLTFSL